MEIEIYSGKNNDCTKTEKSYSGKKEIHSQKTSLGDYLDYGKSKFNWKKIQVLSPFYEEDEYGIFSQEDKR